MNDQLRHHIKRFQQLVGMAEHIHHDAFGPPERISDGIERSDS